MNSKKYIFYTSDAFDLFPHLPWGDHWDVVSDSNSPELLDQFDIVLPHTAGQPPKLRINGSLRIAIMCDSIEHLKELRNVPIPTIIFQPNALCILERHKETRKTLVVQQSILRGETIEERHLGKEDQGTGVCISRKGIFLGRSTAHDLLAGAPIDFGCIE